MLSDDSDVEDIDTLTINEHYAKAFEYKKEREELAKLKEKYGSDLEDEDEEDSEDAETEDEDGEELTPAVDAAIFRTLARIRRKDPVIYDSTKSIFEDEQQKSGTRQLVAKTSKHKTNSGAKPITIRQVALESALNASSRSPSPQLPTHVEEQRALRNETISAFQSAVTDVAVDDDDNFLVPREKTKDELELEEEEYREFLAREVGADLSGLIEIREEVDDSDNVTNAAEVKSEGDEKTRKSTKGKSKAEDDQEFLMNYILNRGWIDRSTRRHPTYREITDSSIKTRRKNENPDIKEEPTPESSAEQQLEEDDDEFEEIADRFESSYNFRFEEPDAAVIKTFPRNLPSTVRREDTTRKEARERRKQRKEEELQTKREEVKMLKALKMKEVRRKLERIGREGGKDIDKDEAFQDFDLDGDWDPEAHDMQMAALYGSDDGEAEDEIPQWDDDIDIGDIVHDEGETSAKKKKKKQKKKDGVRDEDGVDVDEMDADAEFDKDEEEWDGTEEMRKRKLDEYMEEIYGLEFNDVVAGIPTRFKYATVAPQTYSLSPTEILLAKDSELNQYMSVKKYAPYKKDNRWDNTRNERLKDLREHIRERWTDVDPQPPSGSRETKKRMGKKERQKLKSAVAPGTNELNGESAGKESKEAPLEHKRKANLDVHDAEGGLPEKKRKRRHKKVHTQLLE